MSFAVSVGYPELKLNGFKETGQPLSCFVGLSVFQGYTPLNSIAGQGAKNALYSVVPVNC